jgi:hypothetical protein
MLIDTRHARTGKVSLTEASAAEFVVGRLRSRHRLTTWRRLGSTAASDTRSLRKVSTLIGVPSREANVDPGGEARSSGYPVISAGIGLQQWAPA